MQSKSWGSEARLRSLILVSLTIALIKVLYIGGLYSSTVLYVELVHQLKIFLKRRYIMIGKLQRMKVGICKVIYKMKRNFPVRINLKVIAVLFRYFF